jgi:hypothetical protein
MNVDRQPIPVLYVACVDELPAIRAAWERLDVLLPVP